MIQNSELILNNDGTLFHLHLKEEHVADNVILVGDPDRCELIAKHFDKIMHCSKNREFVTIYGTCQGKPITVISTGIGCDNIDIVMTELDAAVNVDLKTREIKTIKKHLNIIRLGTSGALQNDIEIGDYVMSNYSIGIDGLAHFYKESPKVREIDFEDNLAQKTNWAKDMAKPYIIKNSDTLIEKFSTFAKPGVTISAGGFYGPQGRVVRLALWDENYLINLEKYRYNGLKITNFEMEGAAIALLSQMLGHNSLTVCAIIAQRQKGDSNPDYGKIVENLISKSLQLICK